MTTPISAAQLGAMETQLYGTVGLNNGVPNYLNNYQGSIYDETAPYGNLYGQALMNPSIYSNPTAYNLPQTAGNGTNIMNSAELQNSADKLADYYATTLDSEETLMGAAVGGAAFGVINHPRYIVHPYNSIKGLKDVSEMFKGVRETGSAMNTLWKENSNVMREAYFQMHKAASRANSKIGLYRKRYSKEEYEMLKGIMQEALDSKDINKIAQASARLKSAYVNNGLLPRGWNSLLGKETAKVTEKAAITENTAKAASEMVAENSMKYKDFLKKGSGIGGAIFFMGMELLMSFGKIKEAFEYDRNNPKGSNEGWKQLGQTLVKGLGSAVGWAAGEALGHWGAAALGAKIGTAVGGPIGAAIGGVLGLIGGSVGCWLTGKITHGLVGDDVANKIQADKLKKTPEGMVQLLSYVNTKAQSEPVPPSVYQSAMNIATAMG